jgi:hypothetical protein
MSQVLVSFLSSPIGSFNFFRDAGSGDFVRQETKLGGGGTWDNPHLSELLPGSPPPQDPVRRGSKPHSPVPSKR